MARKTTEIVTLSLRIREELRKRVAREAKRAKHSMNAEIIQRLEQSFEQGDIIKTIKEAADDLKTQAVRAGFIAGFNSDRDKPLLESFKDDARRSGLFKDDAQALKAFKDAGFDPDKSHGEEDKS
jgi:hypothetical protein